MTNPHTPKKSRRDKDRGNDGRIALKGDVNVDQGVHGITRVGGTPMISRDPLSMQSWEHQLLERRMREEAEQPYNDPNMKWCSHKDHEGERWLHRDKFGPDKNRQDGKFPYCRDCKNRYYRNAYKKASES